VVEATAVSLTTSKRHSAADELMCTRLAAALDARAYANSGGARVDAGASRARAHATEGRAVWWSQCEWRRQDVTLFSFLLFFGETVYADEGSRPVDSSAA
jgi:hypothetical protein